MKKLNLAIIGQGRSGKDIHGLHYRSEANVYFNVKYVVDADEHRRRVSEEIYPGCVALADYHELFAFDDIDLVVNASYSDMHFSITKDLLEHNLNVMVEKPLARTRYECDVLINLAKERGLFLTAFQQSFFAPYYLKVKEIMKSGILGEIKQISIAYSGFSRRWDWQTLQKRVAGNIYNTGPHPIGLALGYLDFDPDVKVVYSKLGQAMTFGDSDDFAKIILEAPGKPIVDLEVNSNDAFTPWNVKVLGTRGCLQGGLGSYKMVYVLDEENPAQTVCENFIEDENKNPVYCREALIKHEEEGTFDAGFVFTGSVAMLYEEVYYALTEGRPVSVPVEVAREVVSIIDKVHADNPLTVKF